MTNKEFFIHTLKEEAPVFVKVVAALPKDKGDFRPHEKGRTAYSLAAQLALQPKWILQIAVTGLVDATPHEPDIDISELPKETEKNFAQLVNDLALISDEDWDKGMATMTFEGGKWETTRYGMAWSFFLDSIHHRGQLTAYLRMMGAKVPSVYGGSADEKPGE